MLTYTEPLPSIRVLPGGDAYPAAIGSLSNWLQRPYPYTNKKITGWNWDNRVFSEESIENSAITTPANFDATTSGIPDSYFQSGIGSNQDLALIGIELIPESGIVPGGNRNLWAPVLYHGYYWDHKDPGYLFSDDSVVQYATFSGIVPTITPTFNFIELNSTPKVGVPVVAEQFQWEQDIGKYSIAKSWRKKVYFTGIKDPDTNVRASTYDELSETVLWDNVDTTNPEFILTTYCPGTTPDLTAVFNGQFVESGTEIVGYGTGSHLSVHTRFAPIDETSFFNVETYPVSSGAHQSWTVIPGTDTPNGYEVSVDFDMGILKFGDLTNPLIPVPPSGHFIEVNYYKTIRLEYEPEKTRDEVIAIEANLNPITRRSPRGFVYLSNSVDSPSSIELEAKLPELSLDTYGPLYVGNTLASIVATVKDQDGIALEDQIVTFYINNIPIVGSYGTSGDTVDSPTNEFGQAKVFYVPPRSIDEIGEYITYDRFSVDLSPSGYPTTTQVTKLNTDTLSVEGDLDEIFLYEIYTDDAILGLYNSSLPDVEATQLLDYYSTYFQEQDIWGPLGQSSPGVPSAGAQDWEAAHRTVWNLVRPKLFTGAVGEGRRILAAVVRSDLLNPHTYTYGAVGPFQPIAVETVGEGDYNVVYDTSTYTLPVPSGSMPGPISIPSGSPWGYFLVSPTTVKLQASVYNERTDEVILSNEIDIQLRIPPYLNGMWTIDAINATDINEISALLAGITASGQKVPLGFRLRSNGVTLAGALNGVTFLDVNYSSTTWPWP